MLDTAAIILIVVGGILFGSIIIKLVCKPIPRREPVDDSYLRIP